MRPVDGESRPAIRPSIVDLPLPDGPVIATDWPRAIVRVVGFRIVSSPAPLVTVRETSTSAIIYCPPDPRLTTSSTIGLRKSYR